MTRNEIARTAFKYRAPDWCSPFGYTSSRDKNEMCPYCKNEDTEIVRDKVALAPFRQFYGDIKFTAVACHCCQAVFSFYEDTK